jgi:hypothetical protein
MRLAVVRWTLTTQSVVATFPVVRSSRPASGRNSSQAIFIVIFVVLSSILKSQRKMYLALFCLLSILTSLSIASPAPALKYAWDPPRNAAEKLARDAHLEELGLESALSKRTQFPDYPPSCKLCEKDYPNIQSCANASVVLSQPSVVSSTSFSFPPELSTENKGVLTADCVRRSYSPHYSSLMSSSARAPILFSLPIHNVSTALRSPTKPHSWFRKMVSPYPFVPTLDSYFLALRREPRAWLVGLRLRKGFPGWVQCRWVCSLSDGKAANAISR